MNVREAWPIESQLSEPYVLLEELEGGGMATFTCPHCGAVAGNVLRRCLLTGPTRPETATG